MATISLEPATEADAEELAAVMRESDRQEVMAVGHSPAGAILMSMRASTMSWTVRYDGEIMAMWGVVETDVLSGRAVPWLLTGQAAQRHQKAFVRMSIDVLDILRDRYSVLVNLVDARYTAAIRWARRLGFMVLPRETKIGLRGEAFVQINIKGH